MTEPRLLYIDIEWEPATAYVWRMYDENISPDQLIDSGGMLCFCAKWSDEKEYQFYSKWDDGRYGMAKAALDLLSEADAVITFNGERYDLPKILGEILLAGLDPPPPPTSIDLYKVVKKFGFVMNKLAYIGPLLGAGSKIKNSGFTLWKEVIAGDKQARREMRKYCIEDVKLLVNLYPKLKGFIRNHPNLGDQDPGSCGSCGSSRLQRRGFRRTKFFRIQRVQCQDCGAWSDGVRNKI